MSAIKEHYHETLNNMHYEYSYSQTPEQAAKMARAETLNELINYMIELQDNQDRYDSGIIMIVRNHCEELLNAIQ